MGKALLKDNFSTRIIKMYFYGFIFTQDIMKKGHGHINFEKTYSSFGDSQNSLALGINLDKCALKTKFHDLHIRK